MFFFLSRFSLMIQIFPLIFNITNILYDYNRSKFLERFETMTSLPPNLWNETPNTKVEPTKEKKKQIQQRNNFVLKQCYPFFYFNNETNLRFR